MSVKLTDDQRALLTEASRREDRCFVLPSNLGWAAQKVAAKLIAEGLAKEIKAKAGAPIWRRDGESDQAYFLKLSAAGAKDQRPTEVRRFSLLRRSPARSSRARGSLIRRPIPAACAEFRVACRAIDALSRRPHAPLSSHRAGRRKRRARGTANHANNPCRRD
jgi:hypothetical protein